MIRVVLSRSTKPSVAESVEAAMFTEHWKLCWCEGDVKFKSPSDKIRS